MVTFPEMPDRLEQANLGKLSAQRIRKLAETDPDWPLPLDEAPKVGRIRLFDWRVLEPYFRDRKSRQGYRSDKHGPPRKETPDDATETGSSGSSDEA
ncbi:hypothetical protein ACIP98_21120 [Streptomyces sp. NPDC088354]|uniref:hypothetical protein n=1 Tax=Streptomyces sp. NPDC088354 TaxID=3365856 RepID=UPI00381124E1